ncbi:hypothetical protein GCK72_017910 [Caenorhabditis remanei]|uniref:Uncharacterized protein n=1 Tax=Caenorhabditis remanei TaxID=31234 RepID=A0A6A5G981_CAERE|nr:hypothetical protein GCK72_017910 [Caenorhabditis remanei]KAF1751356.1 hypothetical protein GCK72_017910 [Caenorhabditis remanei]
MDNEKNICELLSSKRMDILPNTYSRGNERLLRNLQFEHNFFCDSLSDFHKCKRKEELKSTQRQHYTRVVDNFEKILNDLSTFHDAWWIDKVYFPIAVAAFADISSFSPVSLPAIFTLVISAFPVAFLLTFRLAFFAVGLIEVKFVYTDLKPLMTNELVIPDAVGMEVLKDRIVKVIKQICDLVPHETSGNLSRRKTTSIQPFKWYGLGGPKCCGPP